MKSKFALILLIFNNILIQSNSDLKHCYIYLSYNIYTSSKLMTFWVKQTTQWENKRDAFVSFIMRVRTLSDLQ